MPYFSKIWSLYLYQIFYSQLGKCNRPRVFFLKPARQLLPSFFVCISKINKKMSFVFPRIGPNLQRHCCYTFICSSVGSVNIMQTAVNNVHPLICNQYLSRYLHSNALKSNRKPFPVIGDEEKIEKDSHDFVRNVKSFETYEETYKQAVDISLASGGEKSIERHVKRHGKLLLADRIKLLLDDADEFLELSLIGGIGMEYGHIPRANVLTGIGKVMGRYCLILANDGAFKGGSIYPISLKKQLRAQEIAKQNRLPCIYLVDSAGAFLPLQAEIFNPGGSAFFNEAVMSAAKIPQIAIVCGSCTAGGAYVPTMADEAVIVDKTGAIFLGGPPLVQAALGEIVSAEDLGGATVHCGTSGCTDYFAKTEEEALGIGRDIVASLNVACSVDLDIENFDEPTLDPNDIPGLISSSRSQQEINMYQIIARLVDGSRFQEFKLMYGKGLLAGFAHIKGHLVGVLANQGEINEKEASKGAHFTQLCCQRSVPLIFLQNTHSNSSSLANDAISNGITLKAQARMLAAISCATVPKITVIVGNGYGLSHYIMGGRAVSPNFLFAWPNARVAMMEPNNLVKAIADETGAEKSKESMDKLTEKVHRETSAIYGATRILNDGIILPQDTRQVLSQCLSICKAYKQAQNQDAPVLRM